METIFVVYPNPDSYADALLGDLHSDNNVYFVKRPHNRIMRDFQYYYTSLKANALFRLPFQSLWYKSYTPKCVSNISYIFLFLQGNSLAYDLKYLEYLKKNYKNSIICFNWLNIASTVSEKYITFVNSTYDYVFTFDINDHLKYGWTLHDAFYSDVSRWVFPDTKESDVFFIGEAKERLDILHQIFDIFTNAGYKCDFYITGVERHKQIKQGIKYNTPLSYYDVLSHCAKTKVILEIVQKGQVGLTLRTCESISLGKKLLTNNNGILQSHFNGSNIFKFDVVTEIQPKIIIHSKIDFDDLNRRKSLLSPSLLMQEIKEITTHEK